MWNNLRHLTPTYKPQIKSRSITEFTELSIIIKVIIIIIIIFNDSGVLRGTRGH